MAKSTVQYASYENEQVSLKGDLLFSNIKEARAQLERELLTLFKVSDTPITISLKGVKRVDSSALSLCLCALRLAKQHQKSVRFIDHPNELMAIADLVGVTNTFS
jgi:phospholipid transport system transporter-binding protein